MKQKKAMDGKYLINKKPMGTIAEADARN